MYPTARHTYVYRTIIQKSNAKILILTELA